MGPRGGIPKGGWPKLACLALGPDLFNYGGGFRFGAISGTGKFVFSFWSIFTTLTIPIQAFPHLWAGSHAILWTDRILELWIYLVIVCASRSRVPKFPCFQRFQAVPSSWLSTSAALPMPIVLPTERPSTHSQTERLAEQLNTIYWLLAYSLLAAAPALTMSGNA